jgi:hypothetical protein
VIRQRDVSARARERYGHGSSNAAVSAGDERRPTCQIDHA